MAWDDKFEQEDDDPKCQFCGTSLGVGASRCPNCDELTDGSAKHDDLDTDGELETMADGDVPEGVLLSATGVPVVPLHDQRRTAVYEVDGKPFRRPYADSE